MDCRHVQRVATHARHRHQNRNDDAEHVTRRQREQHISRHAPRGSVQKEKQGNPHDHVDPRDYRQRDGDSFDGFPAVRALQLFLSLKKWKRGNQLGEKERRDAEGEDENAEVVEKCRERTRKQTGGIPPERDIGETVNEEKDETDD